MTETDEALMQQVQQGQLSLFEVLVHRYRPALLRVVSSKLHEPGLAEDVVQEALLAAFAARQTFDPRFSFRTWLWTITLRLAHKLSHRHRQKTVWQGASAGEPWLEQSATGQPAGTEGLTCLLQSERSELLYRALDELPEAQADALRLRFFGGLPFDEIARMMDSSVSGAKQRVKQGLERLAARLQGLGEKS